MSIEGEIEAFARKTLDIIERARERMTDEDREKADAAAERIFDESAARAEARRKHELS